MAARAHWFEDDASASGPEDQDATEPAGEVADAKPAQ